jgi:hypothetical protein
MAAKVERILVTLRFILVLETIAAICALILLLLFVSTRNKLVLVLPYFLTDLLQFFLRIELLWLLGTTLTHEHTLHLGSAVVFTMTQAV